MEKLSPIPAAMNDSEKKNAQLKKSATIKLCLLLLMALGVFLAWIKVLPLLR